MKIDLSDFKAQLLHEEKSPVTVEKYLRDVSAFFAFTCDRELGKDLVLEWKHMLIQKGYAIRSINSMLASLNAYFKYIRREDCRVQSLRLQKQIYTPTERELSRTEYERLLDAVQKKPRLHLLLQTICATGIRVSELRYFTVEAVQKGEVVVNCKNKNRVILIPGKLRKALTKYCRQNKITSGIIFRTRNGNPLDRSNIWTEMKRLCKVARVEAEKAFPHNLRRLFARCFYKLERDIAKLADVLGHSSINTTRIYIMTTGLEHRKLLDRLGFLRE